MLELLLDRRPRYQLNSNDGCSTRTTMLRVRWRSALPRSTTTSTLSQPAAGIAAALNSVDVQPVSSVQEPWLWVGVAHGRASRRRGRANGARARHRPRRDDRRSQSTTFGRTHHSHYFWPCASPGGGERCCWGAWQFGGFIL